MQTGFFSRWLLAAMLLACMSLAICGCSRSGDRPKPMAPGVFDSASAELKEKWQTAGDRAAKRDYLGAVSNLTVIFQQAQSLPPEQKDALQQAWLDVGNQAFKAANNGDKQALEAVQRMNSSPYGKVQGQR